MVARSNEDGEEAFTCVNVERPRSSGNSKKSNSNRLTSNDEAMYSVACCAQSNDGQIYIEVGKLNGWMASEGTTRYWMYRDDCG